MSGTSAVDVETAISTAVAAATVPTDHHRFGIAAMSRRPIPDEPTAWQHLDFDVTIGPSAAPDRGRSPSHISTAFRVTFPFRVSAGTTGQVADQRHARKQAEIVAAAALVDHDDYSVTLERIDTVHRPADALYVCTVDLIAVHPLYAP